MSMRYCTLCGAEYEEGAERCPKCDVPLNTSKAFLDDRFPGKRTREDEKSPRRRPILHGTGLRRNYALLVVLLVAWIYVLQYAVTVIDFSNQVTFLAGFMSSLGNTLVQALQQQDIGIFLSYFYRTFVIPHSVTEGLIRSVFLLYTFVPGILLVLGLWRIFEKAGIAGWKLFIPIYNVYCLLGIIGQDGLPLILILFTPEISALAGLGLGAEGARFALYVLIFYDFIFYFYYLYCFVKHLGYSYGFMVLMFLFPGLILLIIGWNASEWREDDVPSKGKRIVTVVAVTLKIGLVILLSTYIGVSLLSSLKGNIAEEWSAMSQTQQTIPGTSQTQQTVPETNQTQPAVPETNQTQPAVEQPAIQQTVCPTCGGVGSVASYSACPICGGSGQQYIPNAMYDTVMGWQGIWQACGGCGGSGRILSGSGICPTCNGSGRV